MLSGRLDAFWRHQAFLCLFGKTLTGCTVSECVDESDKLSLKSGHDADLLHKLFTDSYQNIWRERLSDTEVMLKRNLRDV